MEEKKKYEWHESILWLREIAGMFYATVEEFSCERREEKKVEKNPFSFLLLKWKQWSRVLWTIKHKVHAKFTAIKTKELGDFFPHFSEEKVKELCRK